MTKRFRLRFTFWLDMLKEGEAAVAEAIDKLKKERLFAETVRDGIRLICDLRDGKLDVLFELFPWVRAEFLQYMREVASEAVPTLKQESDYSNQHTLSNATIQQIEAEKAWLEAEQERMEQERAWEQRRMEEAQKALEAERRAIEQERQRMEAERTAKQNAMQEQLDRMEQWMLSQGNQPIDRLTDGLRPVMDRGEQPSNSSGGPKQLSVQKFSAPAYDDDGEDLLEIKNDESAGMRATQNFLKSLMGLNEEPSKPPQNSHAGNTKSRRKRSQEMQQ